MSELNYKMKSLSESDKQQLKEDFGAAIPEKLIRALFTMSRHDLKWLNDTAKEINKRVTYRKTSKSELMRLILQEAKQKKVEYFIRSQVSL